MSRITYEMEIANQVFQKLLQEFLHLKKGTKQTQYDNDEMQLWIIHRAHKMVRNDEITWEVFGRLVDEAICW